MREMFAAAADRVLASTRSSTGYGYLLLLRFDRFVRSSRSATVIRAITRISVSRGA